DNIAAAPTSVGSDAATPRLVRSFRSGDVGGERQGDHARGEETRATPAAASRTHGRPRDPAARAADSDWALELAATGGAVNASSMSSHASAASARRRLRSF